MEKFHTNNINKIIDYLKIGFDKLKKVQGTYGKLIYINIKIN
jgi:hypothetical protein